MAGRRRPKKKKPFPFLELPQELRDKVYEHAIDVKAGGFASVLRINRQTHEEAEDVLLRKHCFVLVKFAWPRIAEAASFLKVVTEVTNAGGNMLVLDSPGDNKLTAFKNYRLQLEVTAFDSAKSRTNKAAYVMLPSQNLEEWTLEVGRWREPLWSRGPEIRDLTYHLTINNRVKSSHDTSEHMLLKDLTRNWWSFPHFRITGGEDKAMTRWAIMQITKDKWSNVDDHLDGFANAYQEGLDCWSRQELAEASVTFGRLCELISLSVCTKQWRQLFRKHVAAMTAAMDFYTVAGVLSSVGIYMPRAAAALSSCQDVSELFVQGLEMVGHAWDTLQAQTDPRPYYRVVTLLYKYVMLQRVGRFSQANEALAQARPLQVAAGIGDLEEVVRMMKAGTFRVQDEVAASRREMRGAWSTV